MGKLYEKLKEKVTPKKKKKALHQADPLETAVGGSHSSKRRSLEKPPSIAATNRTARSNRLYIGPDYHLPTPIVELDFAGRILQSPALQLDTFGRKKANLLVGGTVLTSNVELPPARLKNSFAEGNARSSESEIWTTLKYADKDPPSFENWKAPWLELPDPALPKVCVQQVIDEIKRARLIMSLAMWNDKEEDDDLKYGRDADSIKYSSVRCYMRSLRGYEDLNFWLDQCFTRQTIQDYDKYVFSYYGSDKKATGRCLQLHRLAQHEAQLGYLAGPTGYPTWGILTDFARHHVKELNREKLVELEDGGRVSRSKVVSQLIKYWSTNGAPEAEQHRMACEIL